MAKSVNGFVACDGDVPVVIELCEDVVAGLMVDDPFPVFADADDAKKAILSHQSRYGTEATFEIRHVTVQIGDVHETVVYSEDEDDGEEDEE